MALPVIRQGRQMAEEWRFRLSKDGLATPHYLPIATYGDIAENRSAGFVAAILDKCLHPLRRVVRLQRAGAGRCFGFEIIAAFDRLTAPPFGQLVICRIGTVAHRRRVNGNGKPAVKFDFRLFALAATATLGNDLGRDIAPVKGNQLRHLHSPVAGRVPAFMRDSTQPVKSPKPVNRYSYSRPSSAAAARALSCNALSSVCAM